MTTLIDMVARALVIDCFNVAMWHGNLCLRVRLAEPLEVVNLFHVDLDVFVWLLGFSHRII